MTNPIIKKLAEEMKSHPMWRDNDQGMLEDRLRELLATAYTAGMERARELLPEENTEDVGTSDIAYRNRGWNSCRSTAEQAISKEITEKT
jgi:hypothetical protein